MKKDEHDSIEDGQEDGVALEDDVVAFEDGVESIPLEEEDCHPKSFIL